MFEPVLLNNVFDDERRLRIFGDRNNFLRRGDVSVESPPNRLISNNGRLWMHLEALLPQAREVFNNDKLLPTFVCWARYDRHDSSLPRHTDRNGAPYTIDYCLTQQEPWPLLFEDREPYVLQPNQALAFMGEEIEHWRPDFRFGNSVEMIFFYFAEPEHWYLTQ